MRDLYQKSVFRQRQSLPLEAKVAMTIKRIKEWIEHWDGDVYLSWSGGRDSTVLLDLIWSIDPSIPAVFSNTGLELREIKQFVKSVSEKGLTSIVNGKRVYRSGQVVRVVPKKNFKRVIDEDGFALVSKKASKMIGVLKSGKTERNKNMYRLYDEGINSKGEESKNWKLAAKWRHLVDADIKVSDKCCDHLKKEPLDTYAKKTGFKRFDGMMAAEGGERSHKTQCNAFDAKKPSSSPMLFWTTEDVIQYIETRKLRISTAYKWVKNELGEWVEPEDRTGCAFCMFGVHMEKGVNRFQKLYKRDQRMWDTAINKLGLSKPLDLIEVRYIPDEPEYKEKQLNLFKDKS